LAECRLLVKAVTFDLWNTLIEDSDYTDLRVEFLASNLSNLGYSISPAIIRETFTSAQTYVYNVWKQENCRFVPNEERLNYIMDRLSAQLPKELKAEVISEFEQVALLDPPQLDPYALETLGFVDSRYRVGLISYSGFTIGKNLRRILSGHKVLKFFDYTVFSDENGFNKPHKTMFRKALLGLGVKPHEAVHVGDLLQTDVAGAKASGMKAVWLNKGHRKEARQYKPDYQIRELVELIDVLEKLR
jgi:HAD superfamily hydrolase (TIGR01549 family)